MTEITVLGTTLQLLPEKAVYCDRLGILLIADVHLGKSETFQAKGIPIANRVNQSTLDRLRYLCQHYQPERLIVLGDLFHSRQAWVDEVLEGWHHFLEQIHVDVQLILGNHDRHLAASLESLSIACFRDAIQLDRLLLSHEPHPESGYLNICGHVHPCFQVKTRIDRLRLPCFHLDRTQHILTLPSFGEFTGGYNVSLTRRSAAYVVVDDTVIAFEG